MKVIHVVSGLRGGGAEHMILGLCRMARRRADIQMEVVSLSYINNIAWKFEGIRIFPDRLTSTNKRSYPKLFSSFHAIIHLLRSKADILHAHMFYGCMAACIVKVLRPKTRIIFTLHNSFQPNLFYRLLLFITKPLRNIDTTFPNIEPTWYQHQKAVPVANGIETSLYTTSQHAPPKVFTILFAGRLDDQKQPLLLLDVARSLKHHQQFLIRVAGEGPLLHSLRKEIIYNRLEAHFDVKGFQEDVPALLQHAHCLIVPSAYEGMPLVIMEAAAAGVPVICTPAAAKSFNITEAHAYISQADRLVESVAAVISDYPAALEKARLLREKLDAHTIEHCFADYMLLYRKTANRVDDLNQPELEKHR